MNYAGILAGGIGSRMESKVPKQFLKIAEIPIVVRTINTFLSSKDIDKVILAMNPQWMEYCINILKEYNVDIDKIIIITGGATRFLSMVNIVDAAIKDLGGEPTDKDFLCIHDCARPFVSQRIIEDNFKLVKEYDMVTTSLPTIDTVLIAEDGKESTCVPERSTSSVIRAPRPLILKNSRIFRLSLHRLKQILIWKQAECTLKKVSTLVL